MPHPLGDKTFLFAVRVVDFQFEDETVDLCFRQRIGSLLFDRVLCCENEERFGHFECGSGNGRLFFLHAFEQGALHLCGRAVDLVRKNDVCENGPLLDREGVLLRVVDVCSDYVGRQQVGRELNSCKLAVQTLRKGFDREGLGKPGEPFQQNVSIREHGGDQPVDQFALAGDDAAHFRFQRTDERRGLHNISLKFL